MRRAEFCAFALIDQKKIPALKDLREEVTQRMKNTSSDGPLHLSLKAQLSAIERAEQASLEGSLSMSRTTTTDKK